MKKFIVFAAAVWMTSGAYAADFNLPSVDVKSVKTAVSEAIPAASPVETAVSKAGSGVDGIKLMCSGVGDYLGGVSLTSDSMIISDASGASSSYKLNKPFVLNSKPEAVYIARGNGSTDVLGSISDAALFVVTGYGHGLQVSAILALKGVVHPLHCERR